MPRKKQKLSGDVIRKQYRKLAWNLSLSLGFASHIFCLTEFWLLMMIHRFLFCKTKEHLENIAHFYSMIFIITEKYYQSKDGKGQANFYFREIPALFMAEMHRLHTRVINRQKFGAQNFLTLIVRQFIKHHGLSLYSVFDKR